VNQRQLETLQKNNKESRDFAKSCFRIGLMLLLKDRPDHPITITRLCKIAGVSRTAFYRNYQTVDDVLIDEIREFAMTLAGRIGTDVYNNWLALFKLAEEQINNLEAIIYAGYEHKILEVFLSLLPESEDNRTIQTIWLSLFYSLLVKWIKERKPKKPEEMARLAYKYTQDIPLVDLGSE